MGDSERIVLLDVLRGCALGGVFISNMFVWQSGRIFQSMEKAKASFDLPLDKTAAFLQGMFVSGKAMTMFTFLFGIGFGVQMRRAEERGRDGAKTFARRLAFMLLIGLTHLTCLWYGDITHLYALLGFFLLFFRKRTNKTVFIWAMVLALVVPLLWRVGEVIVPRLLQSAEEREALMKANMAHGEAFRANTLPLLESHSWFSIVRANVASYREFFLGYHILGYHLGTFGNFLLGFWMCRAGIFDDVPANRRFFRRVLVGSLVVGVIGNGFGLVMRVLFMKELLPKDNLFLGILMPNMHNLGALAFATLYMSSLALLFQRPFFRRILSAVVAPAGRMALSNYLSQSVLAVFIFTGLGLGYMAKLRPAYCFGIPLGLYLVQLVLSNIWLRYFRFGPAEWVWRSLTYGKAQPMRKSAEAEAKAEMA